MQPTKKISQLPQQTAPTTSDKIPLVSAGVTDYSLVSDLIALFFNNIPSGAHSDVTRGSETIFDHIASGGVWTADNAGVNRNASMTAMVCYINGRRILISAVTARTFTASKDTYIDILDNLDGTGTLVYTEATNNATSSTLSANSLRDGIIVTGATTIAASTSINQGQESRVLPIASSIPYAVTDSIGNLICPRDPNRKLLGSRQILVNFSTSSGTATQITGLTVPIIAPTGRKIKLTLGCSATQNNTGNQYAEGSIWDGTPGSGTQITKSTNFHVTANTPIQMNFTSPPVTTTGSKTYNAGLSNAGGAGAASALGGATYPIYLTAEL